MSESAPGLVQSIQRALVGVRRALLAYCKVDTLVMVRLHEVLSGMVPDLDVFVRSRRSG